MPSEYAIYKGLVSFVKRFSNITRVMRGLQNRARISEKCAIITFLNRSTRGAPVYDYDVESDKEIIGSQVTTR